jgi:hypothetical protein
MTDQNLYPTVTLFSPWIGNKCGDKVGKATPAPLGAKKDTAAQCWW